MSLILFFVVSSLVLGGAYRLMSGYLDRWLELKPGADVPAQTMRDGLDFEPLAPSSLFPQHFSAIAAAGPIVGPILAGTYFGWLPTWLWIVFGSIVIGGVHDITTLIASVRHKARSVAEIVRQHMNGRAYRLFLLFIWISLIYVIIAFADVTAGAFIQSGSAVSADAPGPAVATSSTLYLLLAVIMGLVLRFTTLSPTAAKSIFLPLVLVTIMAGPHMPFDLAAVSHGVPAQKIWNYILLAYCFLASIAPVWLLLQPRGELGGYFLYFVMGAGILGILVGGASGGLDIASPPFSNAMFFEASGNLPPIFPVLFITVACGACSGFHSIVTSGTTSKQLSDERDARPVAYGAMLLEALFACISLATVMILADPPKGKPDATFAGGIAQFVHFASFKTISITTAYQFALLCFATFIFDTLDAATRLARYILMELTGWEGRRGAIMATLATLLIPVAIVSLPPAEMNGKVLPLWQVFWSLFGSSNQLLAALALLAVTVWLWRTGRSFALPFFGSVFMLTMTIWSLVFTARKHLTRIADADLTGAPISLLHHVEFGVGIVLIILATWLVVEAVSTWRAARREPASAMPREAMPPSESTS